MPEVNTNMFIDDNLLSEFDDFPPIDLPQIEPDIQMSPPQVEVPPIDNYPVILPAATVQDLKPSPKSFHVIRPNRKLTEKPIQPNYIVEQNADKKFRYIQKPGTHTILPVQNVGQLNLPADQMKQV